MISVVIPTYNRSSDLLRALKSVLLQTFQNFEVIVVDNNSTDNTELMIKELNDNRIKFVKICNNGIIAKSRNIGIKLAKGDYIAFLDSDDWWLPSKLENSIKYLSTGFDFVYHDLWLVSDKKKSFFSKKKVGAKSIKPPIYENLLKAGGVIPNSSVVIKTELLKRVNGFSEDKKLITVEDFDCWLRISKLNSSFYYISDVLGFYWNGVNNISKNVSMQLLANQTLYDKYIFENIQIKSNMFPVWYLYNIGRYNHLASNYIESNSFLIKLIYRKTTISIKIKAFWMISINTLKNLYK